MIMLIAHICLAFYKHGDTPCCKIYPVLNHWWHLSEAFQLPNIILQGQISLLFFAISAVFKDIVAKYFYDTSETVI